MHTTGGDEMRTFIFSLFMIAVLSASSVYAEEFEGLVLYYTFDEEEKGTITDLSGNGNDAVVKGQPGWGPGKLGEAIEFELSGQSLEVPDSDSMRPDEMTIAVWLNWSGEVLPNEILGKFSYQVGGYLFKMENTETNLWIYDEGSNAHMLRARPMPIEGEWTHLTVTFDGEVHKGYVNGVSGGADMPWEGPINHVNQPLVIGAYSSSMTYTGMIDDLAIYNRALSEEEILTVMEEGHGIQFAVDFMGKLATTWGRLRK
jgi:hypothetical protein